MTKKKFAAIIIILLSSISYCTCSAGVTSMIREAEKLALSGMRSTDERIRANTIEAISQGKKADMMANVAEMLNDQTVIVRFAAAVAVGDMNYAQCKPKLREMTKDRDLNIVMASSYALYRLGELKYIKEIENGAASENQTTRANAAMLLGKIGRKESLPILYKIKNDDDSSNTAAFNATEAIAKIGEERIYKRIWAMLISVYADDRYMGVQAMAAFGGTRGINAIVTMLDDEIDEVRLVAAGQLGKLGDNIGKSIVLEYLSGPQSDDKLVAERCNVLAALAIGQIGDEELAEHLPKLLKNNSPFVQLAAVQSVFMLDKAR